MRFRWWILLALSLTLASNLLALLALSGLAAGFVFDWKSRQYMGSVMYCVMMLSATDR